MKNSLGNILLVSIFLSATVNAMEPSYSQVQKRLNMVKAIRSDGALVRIEFIPGGALYRGDISHISTFPDGIRKGKITLLTQKEAKDLYEQLMNSD